MFFTRRQTGTSGTERLRDELDSLGDAARSGDCDAARRARQLRHQVGLAQLEAPADDLGFVQPTDAPIGPEGLPEVGPSDLTAEAVRGGVLDRGCLLVRGLVERREAERVAGRIDLALAAWDAIDKGEPVDCGYFEHFDPGPRYQLYERTWIRDAGGLWTADSPFLTADVCGLFEDVGLIGLVREYLREPPLISVQKGTLRKVVPEDRGAWHQDGLFLGSVKALNVWISLSRCGDLAPGLDLVPRRLDEIVPVGTEGAWADWTVAEDVVRNVAGDRGLVRPIFNPGDVLLFDEKFLHSTANEETMPETRYAIETWFFGSSSYPAEYAPLAF